jgi:short-subunit dehydrogenase
MNVKDSIVIVTGASSGIGLYISKLLSKQGAKVIMVARDKDLLKKVSTDVNNSYAITADLRDPADIKRLIDEVKEKFQRIDILINNAGQAMAAKVENINLEAYKELMELNVYAPLRLMQLVIPIMRKQGKGSIVNISSQSTKKYIPNIGGYASTKYALNALSLTARAELEKDNIVVSIIRPGLVDTDFGKHTNYPEPDALRKSPDGSILPHVIRPEIVADRVLDLISTEAAELDL